VWFLLQAQKELLDEETRAAQQASAWAAGDQEKQQVWLSHQLQSMVKKLNCSVNQAQRGGPRFAPFCTCPEPLPNPDGLAGTESGQQRGQ